MRLGDLEKRAPAQNQLRFYQIALTPTLFGEWAMVREWGRIGQPGTVRERWFATEAAARAAGLRLRARKERRGYRARQGGPDDGAGRGRVDG